MLGSFGLEIRRIPAAEPAVKVSETSPIGELTSFYTDITARGFKPRGILDVGANYGHWARQAVSVFPDAALIMVEPQDEMQPYLSEISTSRPNSHYIKAGAAREAGELIQTIWQDLAGSSFLPVVNDGHLESGRQRKTPMITLDALLLERFPTFQPDLVKLDIQGFELEALSGGESLFGRTELFIVETSLFRFLPRQPITREIITFMADRGYELYDITEYLRRPVDGALGQVDLAFVKADGSFRSHAGW